MMRTCYILSLLASVSATPAFVFHSSIKDQIYKSSDFDSRSLLESIPPPEDGKKNVIFVLERTDDGAEALSMLAAAKKLQKIETLPYEAHSHVSKIDSVTNIIRQVDILSGRKGSAASTPLSSLSDALDAKNEGSKFRKNTYVVKVSQENAGDIDSVVDTVVSRPDVSSVLLTAIRSFSEVKADRLQKLQKKPTANRARRLDQADDADDAYNGFDGSRYYVSMTPNILAGLLFFFFFVMSAIVGLGCMNRIEGQEVFTDKSPPVGREA